MLAVRAVYVWALLRRAPCLVGCIIQGADKRRWGLGEPDGGGGRGGEIGKISACLH